MKLIKNKGGEKNEKKKLWQPIAKRLKLDAISVVKLGISELTQNVQRTKMKER